MDYQQFKLDTLKAIREASPEFKKLTEDQLMHMYHTWSEATWSASWVSLSEWSIKAFIGWATTSPLQRALSEAEIDAQD